MKKIINTPEQYTDDMLRGIYAAHSEKVRYVNHDLRCYCTKNKTQGKVAIITGGGTGHLPLFLGYVGDGLLDGCAVGNVFQSPSAEQIYHITKEVESGAGVLYIYGNYTGDIMNFDMAAELCEAEGIHIQSIVGADDVNPGAPEIRRGVAGIFFMYKAAGAAASQMGTLQEVYEAAEKVKAVTRTVGFALTPCIIPKVGHPNFVLGKNEMAMGMGIHGEPGIYNCKIKTAAELAEESLLLIQQDMPIEEGEEVAVLINGLGATSLEELYILNGCVAEQLKKKSINVVRTFVGEFATSMEMAGASISLCKVDEKILQWLDFPIDTPFLKLN